MISKNHILLIKKFENVTDIEIDNGEVKINETNVTFNFSTFEPLRKVNLVTEIIKRLKPEKLIIKDHILILQFLIDINDTSIYTYYIVRNKKDLGNIKQVLKRKLLFYPTNELHNYVINGKSNYVIIEYNNSVKQIILSDFYFNPIENVMIIGDKTLEFITYDHKMFKIEKPDEETLIKLLETIGGDFYISLLSRNYIDNINNTVVLVVTNFSQYTSLIFISRDGFGLGSIYTKDNFGVPLNISLPIKYKTNETVLFSSKLIKLLLEKNKKSNHN